MTKKDKHSSGPKTGRGKAVSSRNSLTHGLTARRWLDANEQSLFDETVAEFSADFEPQSSIERVLISKLAECTVRLMRIQQTENAMFDLASSEAGHPEESIRSLDNSSEKLTQAVYDAASANWQFNPGEFAKKRVTLDELDHQIIAISLVGSMLKITCLLLPTILLKSALMSILTCVTLSLEKPTNQTTLELSLSLYEKTILTKAHRYL